MATLSPARVPLPASPASRRSSNSSTPYHPSPLSSPLIPLRPRLERNFTSATFTLRGTQEVEEIDPFSEGSTISVNQPVGSLSISPCSRDVCLASRKGLYILDLANLHNAPRFIPQGGTWQIADCQWSPHPSTANMILSTSSQKLLVWDLAAQKSLYKSIDAHARAITDINWHALNPHLMATVAMDAGIRGWDLRCWDRPFMRLCAWGAAGTQVKWNRQHEHVVATAHGTVVHIWDARKGSVPITTIKAHSAKIYGIDWDRQYRHKLVTCSLDKTVKFWTVPELATSDPKADFYSDLTAPDEPTTTISTTYPVWRARHLPFGQGVLSLPQRGEKALEMFSTTSTVPVERFEGHDDVVKDFVWRVRGGDDASYDDRDFQLVTWSKDRTLRIWPVSKEIKEKVGFKYGSHIKLLVSRRGAPDITYTKDPSDPNNNNNNGEEFTKLPPPLVNISNLTRQKMNLKSETGMTRGHGGGNKSGNNNGGGMDQLEWLTKVVKNVPSPESSVMPSRSASVNRARSRGLSAEGRPDWISLKDEVVLVNKLFPRPKINFEKIDLAHRRLTISMLGPWANGDRMAFIRIHWTFPANYPYGIENPLFELERNPTVSPITRSLITGTIKEIRSYNRQCLVATTGFLLGSHERVGRRRIVDEESDSESEIGNEPTRLSNVPMLIRTCGATFGPNGQLVCFFPKQVVLPRTKVTSRSPSMTRDMPSPMAKALSALGRLQNPHSRKNTRYKPRLTTRRLGLGLEQATHPQPQIQAGSTVTIHDISLLSPQPNLALAKVYSMDLDIDSNILNALDNKKLDHVVVWELLKSILMDPPPAYTQFPPVMGRDESLRRERQLWEQAMIRKKNVIDQIFKILIAERDVQLLAIISCILLDYTKITPIPPRPESMISHSPEQDYFTLPRVTPHITPTRQSRVSSWTPTIAAASAAGASTGNAIPGASTISPGQSSYRTSGWSQILNPSGISLRGALTSTTTTTTTTPKDRGSFGDLPFSKTPLATSYEDSPSAFASASGIGIPQIQKRINSPKLKDQRSKYQYQSSSSASPTLGFGSSGNTPLFRNPGSTNSTSINGSVGATEIKSQKVSFGSASASPIAKPKGLNRSSTLPPTQSGAGASAFNTPYQTPTPSIHTGNSTVQYTGGLNTITGKRRIRTCVVKIDFQKDESPTPSLLPDEMLPICEAWKLAYADYLLRVNLLSIRTTLLEYQFISPNEGNTASKAANGEIHMDIKDGGGNGVIKDVSGHLTAHVCISCSSSMTSSCPSCGKAPSQAMCTYCRLPIRGLSMGCSTCGHKLHSKCFKLYFLSKTTTTPLTCPGCSCPCLSHKGINTPYYNVPLSQGQGTKTSPSITRGFARGDLIIPPRSKGEMTLEHYRNHTNTSNTSGLGLSTSHEDQDDQSQLSIRERERTTSTSKDGSGKGTGSGSGSGAEGLLARARWGGEGLLHWKGTGS